MANVETIESRVARHVCIAKKQSGSAASYGLHGSHGTLTVDQHIDVGKHAGVVREGPRQVVHVGCNDSAGVNALLHLRPCRTSSDISGSLPIRQSDRIDV